MNILLEKLPKSVLIDGLEYRINYDFRIMLEVDGYISSGEDDALEKCLTLFYGTIPYNIEEATEKLIWFYRCGEVSQGKEIIKQDAEDPEEKASAPIQQQTPSFSFSHDANMIYAAFFQQYGIDLTETDDMHWWKFRVLFDNLGEGTWFAEVRKIRAMEIDSKMSKAQQDYYRKMKKLLALPLSDKEQQYMDELAEILKNGGDISEVVGRFEKG